MATAAEAEAERLNKLAAARLKELETTAGGRKRSPAQSQKTIAKRAKLRRALAQLDEQPLPDSGSDMSEGEGEFSLDVVKRLLAVQDKQQRQLLDDRTDHSRMTPTRILQQLSQFAGPLSGIAALAQQYYSFGSILAIVCPQSIEKTVWEEATRHLHERLRQVSKQQGDVQERAQNAVDVMCMCHQLSTRTNSSHSELFRSSTKAAPFTEKEKRKLVQQFMASDVPLPTR